jgi:hypothetical protein
MRLALLALIAALLPQEKPTWPQIVERGQKNLERERELRSAIPREAFDPAALARSLGGDPARAAEFVRTRIAIEPVRGFVKGAQGALVSQRAGWADRALLLATLVADKSPKLVKGSLAPAKQPTSIVPAAPEAPKATLIAEVAARLKTDPKRLEKKAQESDAAAAAFHDQAWTRIQRDLDGVAAALQSAGVKPPDSVAPPSDEVWWVRIGDKDLERPEGAEEKSVVPPAELPAGDVHRLTFRLTIQQGEAEVVVLDVSFRTMDLFGRVLTISNVAGENSRSLTKLKSAKPKDYLDALAATGVFVPLLSGGGKPVSGHPFDLTGAKVSVKNGSILKLEGALDVFGRLPGGGAEKKKELTGAWLEVVRTAPGAEPVATRREILKKGVKGRQRVFDLLSIREILVLPADLRNDFSLDLLLQSDIAVKEALLKQIQPKALVAEKLPPRLNAKLHQFALLRASALRELSAKLKTPVTTGTTLVSFVSRILDGKTAKIRAGFDLLSNPATNLAAPGSWKEDAAFAAGIVDTALEHEIHRVKGAHANTSVQLEQAIAAKSALKVETEGGRLRVVVPGTPGSWYEIDPRTGSCLGYVDEGGGQDMAEYATLLADTLEEIREWQSLADRINSVLECAMNALDSADAEASFAHCMAGVAIGEAFGWAAGGIIGGAAGDNPFARLGGMGLEDAMTGAFSDAMDIAMSGH